MWSSSDYSDFGYFEPDEDCVYLRQRRGILDGIFYDFDVEIFFERNPISQELGSEEAGSEESCSFEAGCGQAWSGEAGSREAVPRERESSRGQRIDDLLRESKELHRALLERSLSSSFVADAVQSDLDRCSISSAPAAVSVISSIRKESTSPSFIGDVNDPFKCSSQGEVGADDCRKVLADTGGTESEEELHCEVLKQVLSDLPKTVREIIRQELDRQDAKVKYLQSVIAVYEETYIDRSCHVLKPLTRVSEADVLASSASHSFQRRATHSCSFKTSLSMVSHGSRRPPPQQDLPHSLSCFNVSAERSQSVGGSQCQAGQDWTVQMDTQKKSSSRTLYSRSQRSPGEVVKAPPRPSTRRKRRAPLDILGDALEAYEDLGML